MRHRRLPAVAVFLCLGLVVAACGSTSKNEKANKRTSRSGTDSSISSDSTDSALAPGEDEGASGGTSSSGGGTSGKASGSGSRSSGGGSSSSGGTAGGGRTVGGVPVGVGVTDKEIRIGIHAVKNINNTTAVVGAKTENPEEYETHQAVADYINKNGGVAGRKLALSIHLTDATSGTFATQAQAACSAFTEDKKVFLAVDSSVGGDDSFAGCMTQHKTPFIEVNFWPFDKPAFQRFSPYLYEPGRMVPERWAPVYIDGLADHGFFDKGAKVGLIRMDAPVFKKMADLEKARLSARGVPLVAEAVVIKPQSVPDLGTVGAQLGNVVLNFRSKGVTHIVFAEYNGIVPFFLTPAAESQGYRPRYGWNSLDLPMTQAEASNAGPNQLRRSMTVGWLPMDDVHGIDDKRGGNYALCLKIARDHGIAKGSTKNGLRLYMGYACDSLFFLKAALDRAKAITVDGLRAAVDSLGTSYDSAETYATKFGPGRYDGSSAVRFTAYNEQCQCYRYINNTVRPVP